MKPNADGTRPTHGTSEARHLSYSVETSQQLSGALLLLKLEGVSARFAVRDATMIIDVLDPHGLEEPEVFALVRRAAPSAQRTA